MRFWPGRGSKSPASQEPVTDLDAIVCEPIRFRYEGKIHLLKVVGLDTFLAFSNAQHQLMKAVADDEIKLSAADLGKKYLSVIQPLCPTLKLEDIMSMEQVQIAALYQLVIDMISGQVDLGPGTEKKKRSRLPIYDTVERSSSPNAPENSDGPPLQH